MAEIGFDAVDLRRLDKRADRRPAMAAPCDQMILPAESCRAGSAFYRIGVWFYVSVVDKAGHASSPAKRVTDSVSECAASGNDRKLRFQPDCHGQEMRAGERTSLRYALRRNPPVPHSRPRKHGYASQRLARDLRASLLLDVVELAPCSCIRE